MRYLFVLLIPMLVACQTRKTERDMAEDRARVEKELGQEASLSADRAHLESLRKEIPEDTRKSNDEHALILELMRQGRENPTVMRDRFHKLVRDRRSSFRRKVDDLRQNYRREETKRREDFLAKQKRDRESFLSKKRESSENRSYFAEQERERLSFFADERARRQNFESTLSAESRDFDAYMRERQKEFDEQYRLYTKRLRETPKANAVTGDEFQKLRDAPASPLGTGP